MRGGVEHLQDDLFAKKLFFKLIIQPIDQYIVFASDGQVSTEQYVKHDYRRGVGEVNNIC